MTTVLITEKVRAAYRCNLADADERPGALDDDQEITVPVGTLRDVMEYALHALQNVDWVLNSTSVGHPQLTNAHNNLTPAIEVLHDLLN